LRPQQKYPTIAYTFNAPPAAGRDHLPNEEAMTEIKSLNPKQAWNVLETESTTVLLDVRDRTEFGFVGHPTGAVNIPWKQAPSWQLNPQFFDDVYRHIPNRDTPILLLCRSGQRSLDAAKALAEAGYKDLTNIEEGFEGALDEHKHRSSLGGWRAHGLPWEQS
jgi:rhodanese-related sulfurtransferase